MCLFPPVFRVAPRDFYFCLDKDLFVTPREVLAPGLVEVSAFLLRFGEGSCFFKRAEPTTDWKIFFGICIVKFKFALFCLVKKASVFSV